MIDPRANSPEKLVPPAPLPHVSRGALKRIKHPQPIPTGCPHCGGLVRLVSNRVIYGREYGDWPYAYACTGTGCGAYVGLHPDTDVPLGICESCEKPAPFLRKDGRAYLEPHHINRLSDGGLDHPLYVGAVCPACHREIHYGLGGADKNELLRQRVVSIEKEISGSLA
ncbi:zinc-finger-containing protein [Pseudomonas aeruginosa]